MRRFLGRNACGTGYNFDVFVHRGAGAYVFTPEEGVCKTVDDSGDVKVFEVMLPTTGAADMVHVLTYTGPVPEVNTPCLVECASVRSETTTTSSLTVGAARRGYA